MFLRNSYSCSICGKKILNSNLGAFYPNFVCEECDSRAVLSSGKPASAFFQDLLESMRSGDPSGYKEKLLEVNSGPNPVFIDGIRCWRRYRLGKWVTMRDKLNSHSLEEFEMNNFT
jgi:DNA-directed RNA polymerase subunit RPC12/RpoP